jgi:head-tail adaptor
VKAGRLKSRARVHRVSEWRDEYRQTRRGWTEVAETWAEVRPLKILLESYGAGEEARGTMELEAHGQTEMREDDIVEFYAGPMAYTQWRVAGPPLRNAFGELFAPLVKSHEDLGANEVVG